MQATLEKKSTISQVTKRDKEYALLMQTDGSTDGNIKNDDNINRINNLIYNGNVKVQDEKLIRTHDLKDVLPKYMIPEHSSIVSYFNLKQLV